MKGLVFDTKFDAKEWNKRNSTFPGGVTSLRWRMFPIDSTTKLTKKEYANKAGIPAVLIDDEGNEYANPDYKSLKSSYTINKWAVLVGDDLNQIDSDGNTTEPENLKDVSPKIHDEY